ncbi:MAG: hypothetical protein RQ760_21915, partial [Sedimentisphaerales bacterium]|nr:hypothetical protein [Sedimentisphaerales bacterium]
AGGDMLLHGPATVHAGKKLLAANNFTIDDGYKLTGSGALAVEATAGTATFGDEVETLDGNLELTAGTLIHAKQNMTAKNDMLLHGSTKVDAEKKLLAGNNIALDDGKTLTGTNSLTIEATNGEIKAGAGSTISITGSMLVLTQGLDLNLDNFTFGNQSNTDLTTQSYNGSIASTTAHDWKSITATALNDITLKGSGNITTNALESINGNIEIDTTAGSITAVVDITATNGGLTMIAAGDITTNVVNPTGGNIEMKSTAGDLTINNDLNSNGGGVKLVADGGKVYTPGGTNDKLNVAITGYSDENTDAGVVIDSGQKAAIIIRSQEDLNLGLNAELTANGIYYSSDDRAGINFKYEGPDSGDPIDVAIYLQSLENNVDVDSSKIDISSAGTGIGTLVIDAYDTVTFGNNFDGGYLQTVDNTVRRIEVASRISETKDMAINLNTLPYVDNPDSVLELWENFGLLPESKYVLRGEDGGVIDLAWVLGSSSPVPLVPPKPLEQEEQGEIVEPDMEAIAQLLADLGIGVQPFLARAYRPSLNTDLNLFKAAEKLLRLRTTLEDADGTRVAALNPLIRGILGTPVPAEEQMTSFVQELANQELAGQWINALTEYAAILNNEIGLPTDGAVARIMVRYGGKLSGPAENMFIEEYLAQTLAE